MLELPNLNSENKVSVLQNPFKSSCVTAVSIEIRPQKIYGKKVSGYVSFSSGNTRGSQDFESDDFAVIVKEIQTFINSLEKE